MAYITDTLAMIAVFTAERSRSPKMIPARTSIVRPAAAPNMLSAACPASSLIAVSR